MRSLRYVAVIIVVTVSVPAIPSPEAAWLEGGTTVCSAADNQAGHGIIDDGFGNLIIIWEDERNGNKDIYAQKFDIYGNMLWAADGVPVCTMTGDQEWPSIVSDGAGGAIIAWQDRRSGSYRDIYAQRLDADGTRLWLLSGVSVCTATEDQWYPRMTSDGEGGAVLAWRDYRDGAFDPNVYAQRIDDTGASLWTSQGVAIVTATGNQYVTGGIASDGAGGAYIAWQDERNGVSNPDIYIQWIDGSGTLGFSADGRVLCDEPDYQNRPEVLSNYNSSVIVVWKDKRDGVYCLYGAMVRHTSVFWGTDGTEICSPESGYPDRQVLAPDGEGGVIVVWQDDRNGDEDIYAQRVDAGGNTLWAEDGVLVCDAVMDQLYPMAVSDGVGGVITGWYDFRKNVLSETYLQRLDGEGNTLWTEDGVRVGEVFITHYYPLIASDGDGGAIASWCDYPDNPYDSDLYIQRIERNGYWGYPSPEIHAVSDVPNDQGGFVNLAWYASRLDPWPDQEITYYSIWKALNPVVALNMKEAGTAFLTSASELSASGIGPDTDIPIIREQTLGSATYFWELIDTQDAQYYEQYSKVLATDFDAYSSTIEYSYYQVAAHTSDPLVTWTSFPDSGYSVDNLAPTAPLGLVGVQVFTPEGMELSWEPNIEEDLSGYRVYKGTSSDFIPDSFSLLATTDETVVFDDEWRWDISVWYKVTAVDIHQNESPVAVLAPDELTGGEVPAANFLAQNHPNPFNPATKIVFGMKSPGPVSLRIYDASGRLVRTLVNENRVAGTYDEIWRGKDGNGRDVTSGVYFYKLVTGEYTDTRKMVMLR